MDNPPQTVEIKILRTPKEGAATSWETFEIPYRRNLNVISALMEIRKNPVTKDGKQTTPPVWDMNCLEQVCGICTMVINGKVRQSCSALIDDILIEAGGNTVTLQPMTKFPTVRDLKVDRSPMFNHLKQSSRLGRTRRQLRSRRGTARFRRNLQQERYAYSRCMTCGCCLEACPQYVDDNYIGPQAIAQVRLFNSHPTGKMQIDERLDALMEDDGITNCGNAQNCVQVCPMAIPLTRAIYETNREITVNALFGWLRK